MHKGDSRSNFEFLFWRIWALWATVLMHLVQIELRPQREERAPLPNALFFVLRSHERWILQFDTWIFFLSSRYAAPEQYIMSTQTPSAPSAPVAAALSPVLWQVVWFLWCEQTSFSSLLKFLLWLPFLSPFFQSQWSSFLFLFHFSYVLADELTR